MASHSFMYRLITIALLFALLSEWLRPLAMMSDKTGIHLLGPFLLTIAAAMAVDLFNLPVLLAWVMKVLISLSLPAMLFGRTHLGDVSWWAGMISRFTTDASHVLQLDWELVSAESRTFLFILSWVIIASYLLTLVDWRRFALWFTVATAGYLLLLSWWPGLSTFPGMLRTVGAGMLLHALHVPMVLLRNNGLRLMLPRVPAVWLVATTVLVAAAVGAGFITAERLGEAAPIRSAAVWSELDLMKWLGSKEISNPGARVSRTGYGHDDTSLGGALRTDEAPAFLVASIRPSGYYRGEAKAVYDGSGWQDAKNSWYRYELSATLPDLGQSASNLLNAYVFLMDEEWLARLHAEDLISEEQWRVSSLKGKRDYMPIFAAQPLSRLLTVRASSMDQIDDGFVAMDRLEGNYWLAGLKQPLASYSVMMYEALEEAPAQVTDHSVASQVHALTEQELAVMLQLPDTLPERVRELSAEITEPYATDAAKAQAVAAYLKQNYTYTLTPPEPKQEGTSDFVDRFLFEQQAGYCDYFSTAMVVLLRSAGIPARWVKGFAAGEPLSESAHTLIAERMALIEPDALGNEAEGAQLSLTLVRNSDAHSWVEVFLPEHGWTLFEPTPGFSEDDESVHPEREEEAIPAMTSPTSLLQAPPPSKGAYQQLGTVVIEQLRRYTKPFIAWADRAMRGAGLQGYLAIGGLGVAATMLLIQVLPFSSARLRIQLLTYACGIGGARSAARLLERIVLDAIGAQRSNRPTGITLREWMDERRGHVDPTAEEHLLSAINLYERLCYGDPAIAGRIASKQIIGLVRELGR